METEPVKRGRGRPRLPAHLKAKRKPHTGNAHKPASDEVCARLDALVAAITADYPADFGGSRNGITERRLGLKPGRIVHMRTGKVTASVLPEWEAAAADYLSRERQ